MRARDIEVGQTYTIRTLCIVKTILTYSNFVFSGVVLEKVCEYLLYNERNKGQTNVPDMDIPPELCLELLMAADYLDSQLFLLIFLLCSPNPLN